MGRGSLGLRGIQEKSKRTFKDAGKGIVMTAHGGGGGQGLGGDNQSKKLRRKAVVHWKETRREIPDAWKETLGERQTEMMKMTLP